MRATKEYYSETYLVKILSTATEESDAKIAKPTGTVQILQYHAAFGISCPAVLSESATLIQR